jgi:hypothetical protein
MVLYWSHPHNGNSIVAPDYFMRLNDSSLLESAHVFSAFENRVMSKYLPNEFPFEWSVGTVIRIFREKRIPNTGAKDPISHTSRMFDAPEDAFDLTAWGAYHSEMSNRLRYDLVASAGPVTLIGKEPRALHHFVYETYSLLLHRLSISLSHLSSIKYFRLTSICP